MNKVDEADECLYWLEWMEEANMASALRLAQLKKEAGEFAAIGKTAKQNLKKTE